ncbi:hypothetical protein [Gordonia soli]|uniref:Uncharacterized protein n=1 Tax=Gordonia soli NBRC 108243 TaxID=1223545 RepID=M0QSA0_9ACTN|nr:hypothetical protein [Gordonia soli]GAC71082.1 hypothetical protein GS4_51_00200 [Gordonia soli NBRC 108243]
MSAEYYTSEHQIAEAAMDLVDELVDVESPDVMLLQIAHRFQTQSARMAQIVMCLGFWAADVPFETLNARTGRIAVSRVRSLMAAGKLDLDRYLGQDGPVVA